MTFSDLFNRESSVKVISYRVLPIARRIFVEPDLYSVRATVSHLTKSSFKAGQSGLRVAQRFLGNKTCAFSSNGERGQFVESEKSTHIWRALVRHAQNLLKVTTMIECVEELDMIAHCFKLLKLLGTGVVRGVGTVQWTP